MYWLSYRSLYRLRFLAKLVATVCTLGIGYAVKPATTIMMSATRPTTLAEFAAMIERHPYLVGGAIGAMVVLSAVKAAEVFWIERRLRDAAVIGTSMRYLYGKLFGLNSGHRITFLAKGFPGDRYIRPRYRYAYGDGFQVRSRARFLKGTALAGIAWDRPGGKDTFSDPEVPQFADEEQFLRYCEDTLRMPRAEAKRLGKGTQQARWYFNYGIVHPKTHECIGVLSIDSRKPVSFGEVDVDQVLIVASIIANLVKL